MDKSRYSAVFSETLSILYLLGVRLQKRQSEEMELLPELRMQDGRRKERRMSDCELCKHADITNERRVICKENITIVQNGKMNIHCKNSCVSINFDNGEMVCSGFERKEE